MKTSIHYVLLSAILLCPLFTSAQIGAKTQQQNSIIGTWVNTDYGYQMKLVLHADGKGEFDGDAISYKAENNRLSITHAGQSTIYNYQLQGNVLTLSGGDIDGTISFNKSGSVGQSTTSTPSSGSNTKDSALVGKWSGQGETIEFTENGKCNYFGQTFDYKLSGNQLTLITAQGNAVFIYAVEKNQLQLSANGQTITYSKGEAPSGSAQTNSTGKGHVAQELVGKWCYVNVTSTNTGGTSSERCITLHPNGTYEYYAERSASVNTNAYYGGTNSQNSDKGTWTYNGQRIYYTSSMGAGSGSYQLKKVNHPKNGDPMIVLDGEAYVTFYQKAPWR